MAIKSLYKDYFQKSRVFLYPALDIKRGVSSTPIETYMSWEGNYEPGSRMLSCLYHLRSDSEFKIFEKSRLLNNKLFHDFKQVEEGKGVYTFTFENHKEDWDNVIKGKYSRLSAGYKNKIRTYIGRNSPDLPYIDSFLNPDKYFKMYAEMMNVKERLLKEVGELCDIPDMERETLKISIKSLEFSPEKM